MYSLYETTLQALLKNRDFFSKDFSSFSLEFYSGNKPDKYYEFKLS